MGWDGLPQVLQVLRSRFPSLSKRIDEAEALSRWASAVGPQIARHTRPIQVLEGVLWVEVDHPVWRSELHHRKRQILEAMNRKLDEPSAQPQKQNPVTPPPLRDILFLDPRSGRPKNHVNPNQ